MSTGAGYFEEMYRRSEDPWRLEDRWYEQRKYALTVAALPCRRYGAALEVGCSVGRLTRLLAPRCEWLLAVDRAAAAARTARERTADLPGVTVEQRTVPDQWPPGSWDLVVLSEVLYYFDEEPRQALLERAVRSMTRDATLVTVHWNHPVAEHCGTGHEVARSLAAVDGLVLLADHREPDFTLQVHQRRLPGTAVPPTPAQAEGLAPEAAGGGRG
ncbi:SAM-dependent methyltransferase [Streptomyces sp. NPDC059740]|uniref:SAM-dependent methyltransferase n=1 Tax=Streptomyces sp. NPDC059740 TaxID=3346926 RepID=UPI003663C503